MANPDRRAIDLRRFVQRLEIRMLILALALALALSVSSPFLLKTPNVMNLLDQSVVVGIVAIGMTFVILTGGIDLSVGSVLGLSGVLFGLAIPHCGLLLSIIIAIFAGSAIGAFSG